MSERTMQNDVNSADALATHMVIAPLVGFSKVVSETMVNMQTSICQLLRIANAQEAEITQLRKLVESVMTRERTVKVVNKDIEEPTGVTLESITRDADILSQADQHDELLKKMEMRKKVIMYPGVKPTQEQLAVYAPMMQQGCIIGDVPKVVPTDQHPLIVSKAKKELEVEAARKAILQLARQHAATTYGTNVR